MNLNNSLTLINGPAQPPRQFGHTAEASPATGRDTGIDLVRAWCVLVVVLLHALMAGVTVSGAGPEFVNTAEGAAWFAPLSWAVQVMPLFFVVGGFAGSIAYRRLRHRGGTPVDFLAGRVHRLLLPAVLSVGAAGLGLAILAAGGVPADLVLTAGFRYGQPLWFLGVFLVCQALLPALIAVHDRAPLRSILGLAAAAVAVEVLRTATGLEGTGFLNLAFVWLTLQQLGFFLADGRLDALNRRTLVMTGLGAITLLAGFFITGTFSPDLIENLNPPTPALLLVGVAQTALLSLVRPTLTRLSAHPRIAAVTDFVTPRTMTIYLWHMPVLLTMAGATAWVAMGTGVTLPEPSSAAWWLTRPLWLGVAAVLTTAAAWALAAGEQRRMPPPTASGARAAQAVLAGLAAVVLLLVTGTTVLSAAAAVCLLIVALRRIRK
ncbi:acyltransferase [Citricoccus alkalitolerans]|uniref:Acyltransferase n=1 Tax=Citricoccus alkalitolerans TaxID=246603 RepID=A0ABV8Y0U8_9MICC